MVNHKLTYDELLNRLETQTNLLADLCLQFDKGNYDYAEVISAKIGTIINFNNKKESLLPNMDKQKAMKFKSTAKELKSVTDVVLYRSLVSTTIIDSKTSYFPKLNYNKYPVTQKDFDTWANMPILLINVDKNQTEFDGLIYIGEINEATQKVLTRKDIVMFYRNKFGGAHNDPKVKKYLYSVASGISSLEHLDHPETKYMLGEKYKKGEPVKYLFEMVIRQIAHELILSIKKEFNFFVKYKPKYQYYTKKYPKNLTDILVAMQETGNGQNNMNISYL